MADVAGNGPSAAGPVPGLAVGDTSEARGRRSARDALGILISTCSITARRTSVRDRALHPAHPASGTTDIAGRAALALFVKRASGAAEMLPIVGGVALGMLPDQVYETVSIELGPRTPSSCAPTGSPYRMSTPADPLGAAGLLDHLERARAGAESICAALLGPNVPSAHDSTVVVLQLPRRHDAPPPARDE